MKGKYAKCMQEFSRNDEFFCCHWIAKSERAVYRQFEGAGLEGKIIYTMVQELHRFTSACRISDAPRSYPECIGNHVIGTLTNPSNVETDL